MTYSPVEAAPNNYLQRTHCVFGWKKETGLVSWLLTLDHKRIGIMYLISTLTAFFVAGMLALGVRTELLSPEKIMVYAEAFSVSSC